MSLCLTFGGRLGPTEWGCISEPLCDLTNALLRDASWDPHALYSPNSAKLPAPISLPDNIPGQAHELIVELNTNGKGFADVYTDDIIGLTIDTPGSDNLIRLERAALLAIHTAARPTHPDEPIPREAMAAQNKLAAEGVLRETKMILGWMFDFPRPRPRISLPLDKYTTWHNDASKMLRRSKTTRRELDTNLGRWVHIGMVIPQVNDFTSRLGSLLLRSSRTKFINIPSNCKKDITLMLAFIIDAHTGVDMNLLAYLRPTTAYQSDSCPHRMGGYNTNGRAWRWYLPKPLLYRATNNMLEHLASTIGPWIDVIEEKIERGSCVLSMTDSTTSEGWSNKSNFRDNGEHDTQADARIALARQDAHTLLSHGIKRYSRWFKGEDNMVTDSLSRDSHLTDSQITHLLFLHAPEQMPSTFLLQALPSEIISFKISLLQTLPIQEQLREK